MNRTSKLLSKGAVLTGALVLGLLSTPAMAQIEIIFPSVEFRATSRPVYYDGHASYWYRGRWYYQEGRAWRSYREEPRHLREYRDKHAPGRKHYERRNHRRH